MWGYFDGENNKNDSIPVKSISPLVFFFTCYVMFPDSGIIKNYTKCIKSMIFSSAFSEIAFFMFFKKVVEVFCLKVPTSK